MDYYNRRNRNDYYNRYSRPITYRSKPRRSPTPEPPPPPVVEEEIQTSWECDSCLNTYTSHSAYTRHLVISGHKSRVSAPPPLALPAPPSTPVPLALPAPPTPPPSVKGTKRKIESCRVCFREFKTYKDMLYHLDMAKHHCSLKRAKLTNTTQSQEVVASTSQPGSSEGRQSKNVSPEYHSPPSEVCMETPSTALVSAMKSVEIINDRLRIRNDELAAKVVSPFHEELADLADIPLEQNERAFKNINDPRKQSTPAAKTSPAKSSKPPHRPLLLIDAVATDPPIPWRLIPVDLPSTNLLDDSMDLVEELTDLVGASTKTPEFRGNQLVRTKLPVEPSLLRSSTPRRGAHLPPPTCAGNNYDESPIRSNEIPPSTDTQSAEYSHPSSPLGVDDSSNSTQPLEPDDRNSPPSSPLGADDSSTQPLQSENQPETEDVPLDHSSSSTQPLPNDELQSKEEDSRPSSPMETDDSSATLPLPPDDQQTEENLLPPSLIPDSSNEQPLKSELKFPALVDYPPPMLSPLKRSSSTPAADLGNKTEKPNNAQPPNSNPLIDNPSSTSSPEEALHLADLPTASIPESLNETIVDETEESNDTQPLKYPALVDDLDLAPQQTADSQLVQLPDQTSMLGTKNDENVVVESTPGPILVEMTDTVPIDVIEITLSNLFGEDVAGEKMDEKRRKKSAKRSQDRDTTVNESSQETKASTVKDTSNETKASTKTLFAKEASKLTKAPTSTLIVKEASKLTKAPTSTLIVKEASKDLKASSKTLIVKEPSKEANISTNTLIDKEPSKDLKASSKTLIVKEASKETKASINLLTTKETSEVKKAYTKTQIGKESSKDPKASTKTLIIKETIKGTKTKTVTVEDIVETCSSCDRSFPYQNITINVKSGDITVDCDGCGLITVMKAVYTV